MSQDKRYCYLNQLQLSEVRSSISGAANFAIPPSPCFRGQKKTSVLLRYKIHGRDVGTMTKLPVKSMEGNSRFCLTIKMAFLAHSSTSRGLAAGLGCQSELTLLYPIKGSLDAKLSGRANRLNVEKYARPPAKGCKSLYQRQNKHSSY